MCIRYSKFQCTWFSGFFHSPSFFFHKWCVKTPVKPKMRWENMPLLTGITNFVIVPKVYRRKPAAFLGILPQGCSHFLNIHSPEKIFTNNDIHVCGIIYKKPVMARKQAVNFLWIAKSKRITTTFVYGLKI